MKPAGKDKNTQLKAKIDQLNQQAWDVRVHDSPRAFQLSQKSLALARKIGYKKGIAEAARSKGFCYIRLSKYDEALPLVNESLSLFKELNDHKGQSVITEYLAVIKRNQGDIGAGMELLFKAISISQQHGFKEDEAIQHYQLGINYKYLGNFDKALESLFRSISIHKENKNRFYQSYPINIIGSIYFETGDYKQALRYYKEGFVLRQEFHDKLGQAGSLNNIGYTFFKLKKYKQALEYCKKSLVMSRLTDDKRSQANALQHIAEIQAQAGDTKQAIVSSNASRKIRKEISDKRGEAEILLFLAGLPEQDPQKVMEWTKEALQIAKETKSPDIQSKAHYCFYQFYKQAGKFKESNRELERHYALEKKLHKNSVNQKMTNLEITRKAEETRKEAAALNQKNEELTRLNKELEIETALERVRTVAMGMMKPEDMLIICETISKQLEGLGLKDIRNVQTGMFYEGRDSYMNYQYYAKHDKSFITDVPYNDKDHKEVKQAVAKMLKGKGQLSVMHINGKQKLKEWIAYQKRTNVFIDKYLYTASSLHYYWHSLGPVGLGISTYRPLEKDEKNLFQRFLNVFELSYRRYMDIEKAEAQAREARIETALERVRAVAMAMKTSDDLLSICEVLYKELYSLGFSGLRNGLITTFEEGKDYFNDYDYADATDGSITRVPYKTHSTVEKFIKKVRQSPGVFSELIVDESELKSWKEYRKKTGQPADARLNNCSSLYYYMYSIGISAIGISAFNPLPKEKVKVLERFANVFKLAYQRYVDISNAEAQAKEAKIEASLEKVRSSAMSMHQSEQLINVCEAMYKELTTLGFDNLRNTQISVRNLVDQTYFVAEYSDHVQLAVKEAPFENSPLLKEIYDEMERSKDAFYQKEFSGKVFADWRKWRMSIDAPKDPRILKAASMWFYLYSIGKGYIGISTFDAITIEQTAILKRFRNVFELAYQRYTDVAKAEVQVREAEIELALERVRARTMAMQHSEELAETVAVLFEQFHALGEAPERMAIEIVNEKENVFEIWATHHGGSQLNQLLKASLDEPYVMQKMYKAWKGQKKSITIDLQGKELEGYYQYLKKQGAPVDRKKFGTRRVQNVATFSKGILTIITPDPRPAETIQLLERFANVFDGTYTRFLDLQKAEAQAKESQVQLALERVRARTMAMQQSTELPEAANILFQQVQSLGMPAWSAGYCIWGDNKKSVTLWMSSEGVLQPPFNAPTTEDELFIQMRKGHEKGKALHVVEMGGKKLEAHYQYMRTLPVVGEIFDSILEAGHPLPTHQVMHYAYFSKGYLLFITYEPVPEAHDIFKRFANVFEQTYTRFLDLQKAEAQTRAAKIEMALERVRSRSLAMHSSGELGEVVTVVLNNLLELGYFIDQGSAAHLAIFSEGTKDFFQWSADPALPHPVRSFIPYTDLPILTEFWDARQKGHDFFAKIYSFEEKNTWFNFAFEHSDLKHIPGELKKLLLESETYAHSVAIEKNSAIIINSITGNQLSKNQIDILRRFSKVFEQAYVRFLDLQKAEAQAREAEIELALERIRARTMAMQKSDELGETTSLLLRQFSELGHSPETMSIGIIHEDKQTLELWFSGKEVGGRSDRYEVPLHGSSVLSRIHKSWKNREPSIVIDMTGDVLQEHIRFWESQGLTNKDAPTFTRFVIHNAFFSKGYLGFVAVTPLPTETVQLLERFASVFDITYTRFLDLQKAEAQVREAQIEASLERVRSRSMAMHQSSDLQEVIKVLTDQLSGLGIKFRSANFVNIHPDGSWDMWLSTPEQVYPALIHIPYLDHRMFNQLNDIATQGLDFYTDNYEGKEKEIFFRHFFENTEAKDTPEEIKQHLFNAKGFSRSVFVLKNIWLSFNNLEGIPFSDDDNALFKRFANVFEQVYTRFLDLKKAEAQAREAEIELALERVRARTMAMQKPSEFVELVTVIGEQFVHLGFDIEWANFSANGLDVSAGIDTWNFAVIPGGNPIAHRLFIPRFDHQLFIDADEQLDKYQATGNDFFEIAYNKKEKDKWLDHLFSNSLFKDVPGEYKDIQYAKPGYITSTLVLKEAYLSIGKFDIHPFTDEQHAIFRRFAKAFGQAYTRFLDLQKAEAQARESQIELGLERVRARAMAMQTSEELKGLIGTVFTELTKLDLVLTRCVIMIYPGQDNDSTWWMANSEDPDNPAGFYLKAHDHSPTIAYFKAWRERKLKFTYILEKQIKKDWDIFLFNETELKNLPAPVIEGMKAPDKVYLNASFNNFGNLTLASLEPLSEEHFDILLRFAKVFDLTYTRFNDLQKAEAQAREAQIEASLERVRSKAMAMQKSDDLQPAVAVVFEELEKLNLGVLRVGISVLNKKKRCGRVWLTSTDKGKAVQVSGDESFDIHPLLHGAFEAWLRKEDFSYVLEGEDLIEYYKAVRGQHFGLPESQMLSSEAGFRRQYSFVAVYNSGGLFAFRETEFPPEAITVMKRFAGVFDLTYKRYLDIQKAEAQAREAQIEAALERVRSRTLAMQRSDELAETASELFRQMIGLGIEPSRLYITIIHEERDEADFWITDEDGSRLAAAYTASLNENATFKKMYEGWKQRLPHLIIDMHGEDLQNYFRYLQSINVPFKGGLDQKRRVQHLSYFSKGFIGLASPDEQPAETLSLLERFAYVFNLTFTRFNDLQVAEAHALQAEQDLVEIKAARQKAEETLTELQATQKQLIQSEKMASLGELTAGIAHEIQNPLNFVNNFSEVSNELLDEMIEEVKKGNYEEVQALVNDVKQNLEKINHHGKRADGIVKGMLQHSRSNSGQKELTDINALCDEYLRLSYHGLRAKDKSFNAKFETDFDPDTGKISIIPQDIGRVVLNLMTNAFYVVAEKKKKNIPGYEPTVSVATKKHADRIEIRVKDNGSGIPPHVLDKIFQPFFTTKPTGQGTGLGLSLSYDIIKAHGGDLKVETREGEGSVFIIQLPISS